MVERLDMGQTVLFGIDGATFTALDPLMESGVMPFFKEFLSKGCRAHLLSTQHPLTPPAWTSMTTGRSPGRHGILDFIRREDKGDQVYFTLYDARDVRCETIWSIANRQNRKVSSLNFVMTAPVTPVCGVVIPGMTHWKHLRRHTHPPEFFERLKAQPWFDAKAMCWDFDHMEQAVEANPQEEFHSWVNDHIKRDRQWFEILKFLLKKEPTDLVSIVFDGFDKISHLCWEFIDPNLFPKNPEPWQSEVRELCLNYFRDLDTYLKETVKLVGSNGRVIVTSDHGFGPVYNTFRLNQFLKELGLLAWKGAAGDASKRTEKEAFDLDWSKTVAYCPTISCNGIYIRAKGDEFKLVQDRIITELKKLREPETGRPFVAKIWLKEEIYPGPAMDDAPDITLQLCDYGFVSTAPSDKVIERKPSVKGVHYPHGIFMAAGEGIREGQNLADLNILDIAPTLLHSLGLPVPSNFEGRVATEIFTEEFMKENPVEKGPPAKESDQGDAASPAAGSEPVRTKEEEDAVYEQLRALGYVE
jgi:predicted AlkP superfamily phosphohydrolase/phosphomutase